MPQLTVNHLPWVEVVVVGEVVLVRVGFGAGILLGYLYKHTIH